MKLALGTAQFGLHYGLSNKTGQVPKEEVNSILKKAAEAQIDTLDTAAAYGNSEEVLGHVGVSNFRSISKIPPMPVDVEQPEKWVKETVERSLNRLQQPALAGLLFHRPLELMTTKGARAFAAATALKKAGLIERIGISIYSPFDLEKVFPEFALDLVQAPLSIIDRRLIRSGWLNTLSTEGVEVHARSVFLQGLLLMSPEERPDYFRSWQSDLERYDDWLVDNQLSPLEATLRYVTGLEEVSRIVVGVNSAAELEENIKAVSAGAINAPANLAIEDEALVNPSRWEL